MEALNKVLEIKTLKRPREEEARQTLERISKQVQPIMRRHKWRVHLLSEFCHPRLLGLNVGGGVEVRLRLRAFNNDLIFLPFEQVLDTMLHELCHNAVGPHNAEFYKLWDELRQECDVLVAKGITGTGQGFDGPGRRLGGYTRQPALSSLQQTALDAAEKRRRIGTLLPSGPKRLGGNKDIMTALTPIQAAAMAAERRMQDELWCGSGSYGDPIIIGNSNGMPKNLKSSEFGESSRSSDNAQQGNKFGLTDSLSNKKTGNSLYPASSSTLHSGGEPHGPSSHFSTCESEDMPMWECGACTLLNKPLAPICGACGSQKPKITTSKFRTWLCKFCTLENNIKSEKCAACDQWRYSYGPPVSVSVPGLNYQT